VAVSLALDRPPRSRRAGQGMSMMLSAIHLSIDVRMGGAAIVATL
jgi:hypothetical protein